MDPDTRRLVMFAGGLGAVLVVLIGASALIGRHSNVIPVVTADDRPIRVKPDNPGGMKIDGAENDVFSGGSDTTNAKLAPASENPDTKALRTASAPPPPVVAAPTPAAVAPPPVTKQAVVAAAKPAPVVTATKPSVAAVEAHPPASGHQAMVQLAALASEEAARNEWQELSKRMPGLLNGHQPSYSHTERDGHTFWRVRTSGFADVAQARTFCDHVRQKGGGCSVADF
jgi:cell division septation protein DedD